MACLNRHQSLGVSHPPPTIRGLLFGKPLTPAHPPLKGVAALRASLSIGLVVPPSQTSTRVFRGFSQL